MKDFFQTCTAALTLILLTACSTPTTTANSDNNPTRAGARPCVFDRARLLALDLAAFDQDLSGGWRAVASQNGCMGEAADLIRDYHAALPVKSYLLYWHEGQVRAVDGDYAGALPLFQMSYNEQSDTFGWNLYVDATIAFVTKDRTALARAYFALANLPVPANAELDQNGNSVADSWPPNIDVVENLLACFEQEYRQAYQSCQR